MMEAAVLYFNVLVCFGVLAASVCRVNHMKPGVRSLAWLALYLAFAASALGMLLDLALNRWVDWYQNVGLVGVLLHFWLTKDHVAGVPCFKEGAQ